MLSRAVPGRDRNPVDPKDSKVQRIGYTDRLWTWAGAARSRVNLAARQGVGGEVGPMPPRSLRYSYGSRIHWMRPRFRAGFPLRIFTVACRTTLPLATGTSSSHPPCSAGESLAREPRGKKPCAFASPSLDATGLFCWTD